MKIVQVLPVLAYGDAIGNDVLAIDQVLNEAGYQTAVYAEHMDSRVSGITKYPITKLEKLGREDILLYHASTGTKLNFSLPQYGGKQVMIYHNITPPHFFHGYNAEAEQSCRSGYEGIRFLSDKIDYCIADSGFNRQDLLAMGYKCPIDVCPIVIPFEDYRQKPDSSVIRKYGGKGQTSLLFVGRIAPNKKQEDIIRAFYVYHKHLNPDSRLFLVGNDGGMEQYSGRLKKYAAKLGISKEVIFPGHIPFSAILAYYQIADAFVCMSEHEGFCVPLIEAMNFHIPIVAYASTAVPETLGKGGLLLDSKEPEKAACAIHKVVSNPEAAAGIRAAQTAQLNRYQYGEIKKELLRIIDRIAAS